MKIKEQVNAFLTPNFYAADPAALEDRSSLLDCDTPELLKTNTGKIKRGDRHDQSAQ